MNADMADARGCGWNIVSSVRKIIYSSTDDKKVTAYSGMALQQLILV